MVQIGVNVNLNLSINEKSTWRLRGYGTIWRQIPRVGRILHQLLKEEGCGSKSVWQNSWDNLQKFIWVKNCRSNKGSKQCLGVKCSQNTKKNKKTLKVSLKAIFNVHFANLVSKEYFSIQRLIILLLYELLNKLAWWVVLFSGSWHLKRPQTQSTRKYT